MENSIDGYHARLHPRHLLQVPGLASAPTCAGGVSGRGVDLGNGHAVMEYVAPWGRPIAKWEPLFGEDARTNRPAAGRPGRRHGEERAQPMADINRNLLIYPNLIINDIMAVTVRTFIRRRPTPSTSPPGSWRPATSWPRCASGGWTAS